MAELCCDGGGGELLAIANLLGGGVDLRYVGKDRAGGEAVVYDSLIVKVQITEDGSEYNSTAEHEDEKAPEEPVAKIVVLRGVAGVATVFEFDWQSTLSFGRLEAVSGEQVVQGRCYLGGYLMRYLIERDVVVEVLEAVD